MKISDKFLMKILKLFNKNFDLFNKLDSNFKNNN